MSHLPIRIWLLVTVGLALSAVITRLVWEVTLTTLPASLIIIILAILVILGIYALLLYLIIKPSLKKLRSLPVRITVLAIGTAGITSSIVHFVRFVPSPEAASPLSVVIASLLLTAGISAYILVLWVIWSIWKARES